jgi:hypothetical protein
MALLEKGVIAWRVSALIASAQEAFFRRRTDEKINCCCS